MSAATGKPRCECESCKAMAQLRALDVLYITRERAQALGFTHEGTLFGVPAWFVATGNEDPEPLSCPKIPALQAYAVVASLLCDLATQFMRDDQEFEALRIGRRLDDQVPA